MYDLLKSKLIKQSILHADETYYNVLDSQYILLVLSGKHDE